MQRIITKVNEMLLTSFSSEQIKRINECLTIVLYDFEFKERETALTIYDRNKNSDIIKKFLATKLVEGCSRRTIDTYGTILTNVFAKINKNIVEINSDDILLYLAVRNTVDNVSSSYQDMERRVLSVFYKFLMDEEIVAKDPTAKIKKIKGRKKIKKAFTEEELERLRTGCLTREGYNYKHLCLLEVLLSTGCRASEVAGIKVEDIEEDKIRVIGKGNKERWVYVNARCKIALECYLKERDGGSPYLFQGCKIGTQEKTEKLSADSINQIVKRIAKRVGVENCHTHRFRRTAATLALRRGMPIELVSKMLGHEQLTTTQIYLELTEDDLSSAHKKYVV